MRWMLIGTLLLMQLCTPTSAQLTAGLAGTAVALLAVLLAAAVAASAAPRPIRISAPAPPTVGNRDQCPPRVTDPDAAGRPRPRAPGVPAAA